ncbi:dihydrolipoamide acetyltransferase family protein [Paracoccus onubensis]|uniref:Dihydrolipoamide acetyltransferase component of pyruvate dehydrogenase complex n=1 Tax=Paracoccus onubensis TaxID=1675788 RepID=A0A418SVF7_9RHOB|nr:dihydrolipoamide acetyltransferase family protein [Paracoccus onubensis]RJE84868.1 2-oxo acid dehydrogenase subunit E2 [Paracoccus onubensis]
MHDVIVPLEQEGTQAKVLDWYVKPGQRVSEGDPLVELETDKVTVEIPAPVAGILREILLAPGSEAKPGGILARIETVAKSDTGGAKMKIPARTARDSSVPEPSPAACVTRETRHSPAVRKALAETGLDPAKLTGTGRHGRLTREDVRHAAARADIRHEPAPGCVSAHTGIAAEGASGGSTFVPHDRMRLRIAGNMLHSVTTAPQVTAVFEADFGPLMAHRDAHRKALETEGIPLSYTAYIVHACVAAMMKVPAVNSRWHDNGLEIFGDVNIGIGTALGDKGLVVPVIRQAQNLSLKGIAARIQDLTTRARDGKLTAADMSGGTFTISNHGVSGSLLAAPIIINQPQSAILGVGKLEKRVVVRQVDGSDSIQIRPMAYVSLTIDHRVLDGHQTNSWLSAFVAALESWKP